MLVIYAETVEEVRRLKRESDARLRRIGRMADIVPWVPNPEVRERLGLRSLPAVVWIRRWPDDFEIYCEGCVPTDDVLERCAGHFPKEFVWRARIEATRRALDEKRRNAPKTLDEAVQRLLSELSDEDKRIVRETPERDLGKFHFGWGLGIRNAWMWGADGELVRACGDTHPDGASMTIIRAVWKALQSAPGDRPATK